MSARYKVVGPWGGVKHEGSYYIQVADVLDTVTGRTYVDGAHRVVYAGNDMKPVKRGKGGTVPFVGDHAWSQAESLLRAMAFAERVGRRA